MKGLKKIASVHANVHNHFSLDRQVINRKTFTNARRVALAEWQNLIA
jgi:putative transposase